MIDFRLPGDEAIYHALNGLKEPVVDAIMVFASSREFALAVTVVLSAWVIGGLRKHALRPIVQAGITWGIVDSVGHQVLKPWVGRIRPCYALAKGTFRQLVEVGNAGSMPSLHAANAFAVAVSLTLVWPLAARVVLPVAALIAISRVFVGVHWPSDVAGGALFGSAVALVIHLVVGGIRARVIRRPAAAQSGGGGSPAAGR